MNNRRYFVFLGLALSICCFDFVQSAPGCMSRRQGTLACDWHNVECSCPCNTVSSRGKCLLGCGHRHFLQPINFIRKIGMRVQEALNTAFVQSCWDGPVKLVQDFIQNRG